MEMKLTNNIKSVVQWMFSDFPSKTIMINLTYKDLLAAKYRI